MGSAPGYTVAAKFGKVLKEMRDLQSTAYLVSGDGEQVRFTGARGKKKGKGECLLNNSAPPVCMS